MASVTIHGSRHSTVNFTKSSSTWTIADDASISVNNGSAIYEDPTRTGNTLINNGALFADNGNHTITAYLDGARTDVTNGETGVVTGQTGFRLGGSRQTMENHGLISVTEAGITVYGTRSQVTNDGKILSDSNGIDLINCDKANILNALGGKINAGQTGVSFSTDTGVSVTFTNEGTVVGKFNSISGSNGNDKVINHGTLTGDISFGDGNDLLDTRQGVVKGSIFGGGGNDTLITDNASVKLVESVDETSFDTVKSTVSYTLNQDVESLVLLGKANIKGVGTVNTDQIHGNSGDNVIKGLGGFDIITGGKGGDTLSGGLETDTFHFATGDGKDVITNFNVDDTDLAYTDVLAIEGWKAITSFEDLMANHIKDSGKDVIIFAGQDSVTLKGVQEGQLHDYDFAFA